MNDTPSCFSRDRKWTEVKFRGKTNEKKQSGTKKEYNWNFLEYFEFQGSEACR